MAGFGGGGVWPPDTSFHCIALILSFLLPLLHSPTLHELRTSWPRAGMVLSKITETVSGGSEIRPLLPGCPVWGTFSPPSTLASPTPLAQLLVPVGPGRVEAPEAGRSLPGPGWDWGSFLTTRLCEDRPRLYPSLASLPSERPFSSLSLRFWFQVCPSWVTSSVSQVRKDKSS